MKQYGVCVADDNEEAALLLCEGLKLHGFEAMVAHDGEQALKVCSENDVGLILLDVCMPKKDGYEVCRLLKANPATQNIIVMFVTVHGAREDIAKGFELGASDYITKPYNLPMILIRVEAAITRYESQLALQGPSMTFADTAYTDLLTGLRNRRFLLERLEEEVEKSHRYVYPVSCVVFDLNEVAAQDDELGPASLDDLLVEVAMSMRNYTRSYDVLARYEGTMFAAVLPHTPLDQAKNYAAKILEELDGTTLSDPCMPTSVALSAGISCCSNGVAFGAEYVLGEAMRGLLQAKTCRSVRIVGRDLDKD